MGKTPTIRDVALRAGVSVATASNVVNGARPVGEASRRKVLEAIAALDYRLDRAASALRGRSTRLVGMVVPDITNVFFASLVQGIETLAERDGYDLLIVSTSEDVTNERRRIEALIGRRIDGLIVVPADDESMTALKGGADGSRLPPTVLVDRAAESPGFDTVRADGFAGGYAAARCLIDLGHRDIAVLTHSKRLDNIEQRIAGCRRALSEASLEGGAASSTAVMISKACAARSNSSSNAPIGRPRFSPSPTFAPWPRSRPRAVSASKSLATCRLSASMISTGCRRSAPI